MSLLFKTLKPLQALADTILPPRCVGTGEIVEMPGMLEPRFWSELTFIEAPFCDLCGMPFSLPGMEGSLCASCIDHPPQYDKARSAVIYNDASRQLVLDFKYGDRLNAVHTFTPWLLRAGKDVLSKTDVIVPVPLHRRKLWQRRFNQAALLAQELGKRSGKAWLPDTLLRLRATIPQKGLSRKERDENVKSAFGVDPRRIAEIKDKNALLIDDVLTSGATLNACAKALRKAGAASVFVLTIARVTGEEF